MDSDYHFGFVTLFLVILHRLLYYLYIQALYNPLLGTGEGGSSRQSSSARPWWQSKGALSMVVIAL
jgi:hypothetical protein